MNSSTGSEEFEARGTDCQRLENMLSDYIDGILDARSLALVESHISRCDSCRLEVRQLRQTVNAVRALPPLTPPAYFAHAVQARITESSRPKKTPFLQWLYPSRQGLVLRLAATGLMMAALLPPVRQTVQKGAWSLAGRIGEAPADVSRPVPPSSPAEPLPSLSPALLASPTPGTVTNPTSVQPGSTTSNSSPSPAINPVVLPQASFPAPVPLSRPAPSDISIQFKVEGQPKPGSILVVTPTVISRRDWLDSRVEAMLSPGARFVDQSGASTGTRENMGSVNLAHNIPTPFGMTLMADQPGVYDLHLEVKTAGETRSSDLLLPIGLRPSPMRIETSTVGPTTLYTALATLAGQSTQPIAVEDGLTGTLPLNIHPDDSTPGSSFGLSAITSEFGCSWYNANGIAHVVLNSATAETPKQGKQDGGESKPDSLKLTAGKTTAAPAPAP